MYLDFIKKIVSKIAENFVLNENTVLQKNHDLLTGIEGCLFFLVSFNKYYPDDKIKRLINNIIDKLIQDLNNSSNLSPNEIKSIIEGLDYCKRNDFLDLDFDDSIFECFKELNNSLIINKNWDLLHGFLSISTFLLIHNQVQFKQVYSSQVDFLYKEGISNKTIEKYFLWDNELLSDKGSINFGIAHGLPSIGIILSKYYNLGINRVKSKKMAYSIYELLEKYYLHDIKEGASYPNKFDLNTGEALYGREFGWCYGDISMILLNINYYLHFNEIHFYNKAYALALKCAKTSYNLNNINDPMLCHGSLGISYLFFRLHDFFKDEIFKTKHLQFLDFTLQNFYYNQDETFFKAIYSKNEEKGFYNEIDFGLLEGNAGLGLIFLSFLNNDCKNWDYRFLTNI